MTNPDDTPSKWERLTPKRVENVVDALRKLTRTGAKDYEPIPVEHAQEMLSIVKSAVQELEEAYAPYVGQAPAAPTPAPSDAPVAPEQTSDAPRPSAPPTAWSPEDPTRIAWFINNIPKWLLPAWSVHLSSRITEEFYEAFEKHPDTK